MEIRELGHVVLQVTDLDRSLKFYRDTLGLPVVSTPSRASGAWRSSPSGRSTTTWR